MVLVSPTEAGAGEGLEMLGNYGRKLIPFGKSCFQASVKHMMWLHRPVGSKNLTWIMTNKASRDCKWVSLSSIWDEGLCDGEIWWRAIWRANVPARITFFA